MNMEVEPKPQEPVAIDMSSESTEAKLARLEQEVHDLEAQVEEARDAFETAASQASFAAQSMKDMHSNPNGGYRVSGPSPNTLMERSKAVRMIGLLSLEIDRMADNLRTNRRKEG